MLCFSNLFTCITLIPLCLVTVNLRTLCLIFFSSPVLLDSFTLFFWFNVLQAWQDSNNFPGLLRLHSEQNPYAYDK